jgi:hypothetical protein
MAGATWVKAAGLSVGDQIALANGHVSLPDDYRSTPRPDRPRGLPASLQQFQSFRLSHLPIQFNEQAFYGLDNTRSQGQTLQLQNLQQSLPLVSSFASFGINSQTDDHQHNTQDADNESPYKRELFKEIAGQSQEGNWGLTPRCQAPR